MVEQVISVKEKREEAGLARESVRTLCRPNNISVNPKGAPEQRLPIRGHP